ncbi:Uncharacterised protein [Mycobacteroides abscessus subsp. abscessus]|nr:Uncharacterised protein [Mycobacteroides abscessus subsp. abscessus]
MHGAGACRDHRDIAAGEIETRVPIRRAQDRTLELLDTGEFRWHRKCSSTDSENHSSRGYRFLTRHGDAPGGLALVEGQPGDSISQAQRGLKAVSRDEIALIGQDTLARRPERARGCAGRKRVRLLHGQLVAGDGREGATPPVTADFRGLLEDQQVLDPGLTQPRSHAQPGYAGSDDRDVNGVIDCHLRDYHPHLR